MSKKIRVAILYGGKSGEHEVSLQSAASVLRHLDRNKYDPIPISIDKQGLWQFNDLTLIENSKGKELPIFKNSPVVILATKENGKTELTTLNSQDLPSLKNIDVFFPIIHGSFGEDGTLQGLLEMANTAYVGCGVLSSSVGMDKDVAKRLAKEAGVPIAPYINLRKEEWKKNPSLAKEQVKKNLHYPVFVKPANMGSSVGIHKVKKAEDLDSALRDAFSYDVKVLIEQGIDAREIEVAVLENLDFSKSPIVSAPSEVVTKGKYEFYSYDAKYLDENGAELILPANLTKEQTIEAQKIAEDVFRSLECAGMARVDLFLDRTTNKFYFNEINTIPGFTSISMYPRMMEHAGIPYPKLLDHLIELALKHHTETQALKRDFQKN